MRARGVNIRGITKAGKRYSYRGWVFSRRGCVELIIEHEYFRMNNEVELSRLIALLRNNLDEGLCLAEAARAVREELTRIPPIPIAVAVAEPRRRQKLGIRLNEDGKYEIYDIQTGEKAVTWTFRTKEEAKDFVGQAQKTSIEAASRAYIESQKKILLKNFEDGHAVITQSGQVRWTGEMEEAIEAIKQLKEEFELELGVETEMEVKQSEHSVEIYLREKEVKRSEQAI